MIGGTFGPGVGVNSWIHSTEDSVRISFNHSSPGGDCGHIVIILVKR